MRRGRKSSPYVNLREERHEILNGPPHFLVSRVCRHGIISHILILLSC